MMKITHSMAVMFFGSFLIQYFIMPPIMVSSTMYIHNTIGKAYLSVITGLCMVLLEVMMHDHQYSVCSTTTYIILAILLGVIITLYRKQYAIDDTQYVKEMMEHHSKSLLISEEILKKTDDYNVTKLAKNSIQTYTDELRFMNGILAKMQ